MPDLERCFVQFIHPGPEHGADTPGRKGWNTDEHRRKFLLTHGECVGEPGASPLAGELAFWGEWEPESEVESIARPVSPDGPRWLHVPYYVRPTSYRRNGQVLQNTDPFVFGDRFLYTVCRQLKPVRGQLRPTFLRDLAPGSLILFGSLKRGEFVLDTVFVVAEGVLHGSDSWSSILATRVSKTYVDVTLRPAYESPVPHELRLCSGATRGNPFEGMFSFVPCLPSDSGRGGFPRPSIRLDGLVTPNLPMGAKRTLDLPLHRLKELWDNVVAQVLDHDHDLALGTRFALPPRRSE